MINRSNRRQRAANQATEGQDQTASLAAVDWRRLLGYLRPYRWRMALAVLALLLSSGLGLAFPLVIVRLLESVTQVKRYASPNGPALLGGGLFLVPAASPF